METIAEAVRKNLATHHSSINHFKDRVRDLSGQQKETAWQELCKEAEEMLKPTLRLAAQIAHAYDEIRQQSNHLMTFTEIRTDPLTRVSNRRALDETLETMFALLNRYEQHFVVVILDIDHFKKVNDAQGHLQGDRTLQNVARVIDETVRDTDMVARYGGEEFVVVMPHTDADGACVFANRVRSKIATTLDVTISGGMAIYRRRQPAIAVDPGRRRASTAPRRPVATAFSNTLASTSCRPSNWRDRHGLEKRSVRFFVRAVRFAIRLPPPLDLDRGELPAQGP